MTDRIRIIKHEAVPKCGSYEGLTAAQANTSIGKKLPEKKAPPRKTIRKLPRSP